MKRLIWLSVLAALAAVLAVPATALAGESKYVRLSTGSSPAYSPSSSSKWLKANQGSVEESGIEGMFASIQSRTSSTASWTTRKTVTVLPGSSASSSVSSNGTRYYWRLALGSLLKIANGYGIINSFD